MTTKEYDGKKRATQRDSAWIPTRPKTRGADPLRLGEVLVGAQELLARRSGAAIPRDEWRSIVGPRIAARTRVGRLSAKVLTVKVASSAWSNELSLLKPTLLSKLQLAGRDVTDIRFKVENFESPEKGGWRTAKPGPHNPMKQSELPAELQKRLNDVDDPNLRAAISEAARWSLGQKLRPGR